MKTVIINGSPRKNWNTARILKEARRGAEAAGHEITYVVSASKPKNTAFAGHIT